MISLPITQYPDIAPPTITVRATYTGANAETVLKSVIAPLEDQLNGVENMMYMSSTASNNGSAMITLFFKQGSNPDMDAVNVQNRVSMAQGLLPAEVTQVGVITMKRQTSFLVMFSIYDKSGHYDTKFLENYAKINLIPEIQRIPGVGETQVMNKSICIIIVRLNKVKSLTHLISAPYAFFPKSSINIYPTERKNPYSNTAYLIMTNTQKLLTKAVYFN